MEEIPEKLILLAAGSLLGYLGAKLKWRIEKEKILMEARRSKIRDWRKFIHREFEQATFHETVIYSEMRHHLGSEVRSAIEGGTIVIRQGRSGNVIKSAVLDDLSRLEKEWKLL